MDTPTSTPADIFAVGQTLDYKAPDGTITTFKLRPPNQYEQGEFQRWLEQKIHDAIDRSSDSEERKIKRHSLIDAQAGMGEYAWDGPSGMESRFKPEGYIETLKIVCRDQGMTDEIAQEIFQQNLYRLWRDVMESQGQDPKALAPVLAALGFPTGFLECEPSVPSSNNSSTHPSTEHSPNSEDSPTASSCSSTASSEAPMG